MSEEKLYAVKNRSGEFWDFSDSSGFWSLAISDFPTTPNKKQAELAAKDHGGHVVTFVEEPKKVVLTKEQAEFVEKARESDIPATYISNYTNAYDVEESLLMNAYVNGYTVAKEKKYIVKVPHTDDSYFYKVDGEYCNAGDSYYLEGMTDKKWFTDAEIEHYGLGDCEKVWCDSDDE